MAGHEAIKINEQSSLTRLGLAASRKRAELLAAYEKASFSEDSGSADAAAGCDKDIILESPEGSRSRFLAEEYASEAGLEILTKYTPSWLNYDRYCSSVYTLRCTKGSVALLKRESCDGRTADSSPRFFSYVTPVRRITAGGSSSLDTEAYIKFRGHGRLPTGEVHGTVKLEAASQSCASTTASANADVANLEQRLDSSCIGNERCATPLRVRSLSSDVASVSQELRALRGMDCRGADEAIRGSLLASVRARLIAPLNDAAMERNFDATVAKMRSLSQLGLHEMAVLAATLRDGPGAGAASEAQGDVPSGVDAEEAALEESFEACVASGLAEGSCTSLSARLGAEAPSPASMLQLQAAGIGGMLFRFVVMAIVLIVLFLMFGVVAIVAGMVVGVVIYLLLRYEISNLR